MQTFTEHEVDLEAWYNQTDEHTDKLRGPGTYTPAVMERLHGEGQQAVGTPLPWQKARGLWALRPGEVTVWAGINGHGKSQATGQVALDLACRGERVCVASMEMMPETTVYRMTRQALGNYPPMQERVAGIHTELSGQLWIYDHRGTIEWQKMIGLGRCITSWKRPIHHLFIDSLMKLGIDTDDYNAQKRCVNELCALAHDTGLHIHLIHHARKSGGEDHPLDKFSVKGAGEIMDLADNGVLVWRNKKKEREAEKAAPDPEVNREPDALMEVCKQRDGEWEGRLKLWFHQQSMQFIDRPGPPVDYVQMLGLNTEAA